MVDVLKLRPAEQMIFNEIIDERTPDYWTSHRRQLAALLAREVHRVSDAQEELARVGFVTVNGRGNLETHPLVRVVAQGLQTIVAYRRTLGIHARALGGDARDIARRRHIRIEQQDQAKGLRNDLISWPDQGGNA